MAFGESNQGALNTECCLTETRLNTKLPNPWVPLSSKGLFQAAQTLLLCRGSGGEGGGVCRNAPMTRLAGLPVLCKGAGQRLWPRLLEQ